MSPKPQSLKPSAKGAEACAKMEGCEVGEDWNVRQMAHDE